MLQDGPPLAQLRTKQVSKVFGTALLRKETGAAWVYDTHEVACVPSECLVTSVQPTSTHAAPCAAAYSSAYARTALLNPLQASHKSTCKKSCRIISAKGVKPSPSCARDWCGPAAAAADQCELHLPVASLCGTAEESLWC